MTRHAFRGRVRTLARRRRQWLRAQGRAYCERHGARVLSDAALRAACGGDDMPAEHRAALDSLTDEQLEVLCADEATLADLPELTLPQLRALVWPRIITDA
jgi:hypothetical protein